MLQLFLATDEARIRQADRFNLDLAGCRNETVETVIGVG